MARASGAATRLFEIIDRSPAMPASTSLLELGRIHDVNQPDYSFGAVGDAVTRAFPSNSSKTGDTIMTAASSMAQGESRVFVLDRSDIEFENVSFAYPDRPDKLVLRNVSFSIRAGDHIAVVGGSGGGKSTLAKLITRLYDPTRGRVLIGGVDVRE